MIRGEAREEWGNEGTGREDGKERTYIPPFVCPVPSSSDGFSVFDEDTADGDFVRDEGFFGLSEA